MANGHPIAMNRMSEMELTMKMLTDFLNDESGQDLIEYTLLLALIVLLSAGLLLGGGKSVSGIWSVTNSRLAAANTAAS